MGPKDPRRNQESKPPPEHGTLERLMRAVEEGGGGGGGGPEVVALRAKAEGGDAVSVCELAHHYEAGTHGLKKDLAQSFK